MGSSSSDGSEGNIHLGSTETTRGRPEPNIYIKRVVPQSSSFCSSYSQMGDSRYGSGSNSREQQMFPVPIESHLSNGGRDRLSSPPMEFPLRIYFPSDFSNSQISSQAEEMDIHSHSSVAVLAEEAMVCDHLTAKHRRAVSAPSDPRFALKAHSFTHHLNDYT